MAGAMGGFLAGSIVAKMVLDKTGWNSSIQDVKKDTDTLASRVNNSGTAFKDLATKVATAGVVVVGTLGAMVKRAADYQGGLYELSQQTGVSVEDLSSFKLALDTSGSSLDSFAFGMKGLSGLMADAADKNPRAIKTFDDLKVSFENVDHSLRPTREVFLDISQKFSTMQDGARKTALAVDIFGRSGMDLIPTLNLGRDGMGAWISKAEELGLVVSTKDAKAADDFNDKLKTLQLTFDAATQKLAVSLLPMLTTFVEKVTEVVGKIGKWIEQNPELIKQLTETAFRAGALMTAVILLTNPIYAVAAAAAAAVIIFIQLQSAIDAAEQASVRCDTAVANQIVKLKTIADAAGLTRKEFAELAEKYDNNYIALSLAIDRGKEGIELQKAAIEYGAKHKKVVDDERIALEKVAEAARIATLKKAGLLQVTQDLIPPVRDLAAEQLYLSLVWDKSLPKARDLGDALTKFAPTIDEIVYATEDLVPTTEATLSILQSGWEGLYTDLAQGWGDLVAEYCAGGMTLQSFMEGIWDNIKQSFFRTVGEMISKWLINLLKDTIVDATKKSLHAAAGAFVDMGKTVGSTIAGVATNAINTVSGVVTAVTGILALFKKEDYSQVTYWLKMIKDNSQEIRDYLFIVLEGQHLGYMHDIMVDDNKCMWDLVYKGQSIIDILSDSNAKLQGILDRTGKAQTGAFVMSPTLMAVGEQAPRIPEIILPEPIYERNLQMAAAMGGGQPGGRPIELWINGEPVKFPMKENMRKIAIDLIPYMTKNEQLKIHPRSVRAF